MFILNYSEVDCCAFQIKTLKYDAFYANPDKPSAFFVKHRKQWRPVSDAAERRDGRTDGRTNGRMEGQTDIQTDTDRQTDRQTDR